jgi:hypothetical protein
MHQMTRNLAVEWAEDGIRVNAVAPWYIRTRRTSDKLADPDYLDEVLLRTPLGRIGEPEEVAGAVAFLCLPAASLRHRRMHRGRRRLPALRVLTNDAVALHPPLRGVAACFGVGSAGDWPCPRARSFAVRSPARRPSLAACGGQRHERLDQRRQHATGVHLARRRSPCRRHLGRVLHRDRDRHRRPDGDVLQLTGGDDAALVPDRPRRAGVRDAAGFRSAGRSQPRQHLHACSSARATASRRRRLLLSVTVTDANSVAFRVRRVIASLPSPVFMAPVPDGSGRCIVGELAGRIRILSPGTARSRRWISSICAGNCRPMANADCWASRLRRTSRPRACSTCS